MAQIAARPDRYALFSDFDGTLVEIAERPEEVMVPADLATNLGRVRHDAGRSARHHHGPPPAGRWRSISARPGLEASGLHGIEFNFPLTAGGSPATLRGAARPGGGGGEDRGGRAWLPAGEQGRHPHGSLPAGAGGGRPAACRAGGGHRAAQALAHHLKDGRAVIEIIPNGTSKGTALAEFMRRTPYAGRVPVMMGDDKADEDAFAVAQEAGGFGLKVAGEHFKLR
jgi:trehalose 6-phosphate phosphatase